MAFLSVVLSTTAAVGSGTSAATSSSCRATAAHAASLGVRAAVGRRAAVTVAPTPEAQCALACASFRPLMLCLVTMPAHSPRPGSGKRAHECVRVCVWGGAERRGWPGKKFSSSVGLTLSKILEFTI